MAKTEEAKPEEKTPEWITTVKLGSIEEAKYLEPGDVVDSVNKSSGEVTVLRRCARPPYGRSTGKL